MSDEFTLEQAQELLDFLRDGEIPEGFHLPFMPPKMSSQQASAIIYILQEHIHILPDNYELCDDCKQMYDTWNNFDHYITRTGERLCESCSDAKAVYHCCIAGIDEPDYHEAPGRMMVVTEAVGNVEPGLYRITDWPFYSDGMISMDLFKDVLTRIGDVPEDADTGDYAIGFICQKEEQKIIHAQCGEH